MASTSEKYNERKHGPRKWQVTTDKHDTYPFTLSDGTPPPKGKAREDWWFLHAFETHEEYTAHHHCSQLNKIEEDPDPVSRQRRRNKYLKDMNKEI